jgi:hypothetical protein
MLPCVVATKTKAHSAEPSNDSSALPQANIWPEMRKIVPKRDEMAHFGAIAHFLRTCDKGNTFFLKYQENNEYLV